MKRRTTLLILCIMVVNACTTTPQVTVTLTSQPSETPTPIPTPTLHPQFLDLQAEIDEVEGYKLTNDGMIQYQNEVIPGIQVTVDGHYVLAVGDEILTLEDSAVTFGEDGEIEIDGYELSDDGEWVEAAISEVMTAAQEYFEKLGYSTENVEFREGQVTTTGWVDGVKVFEMNNNSGEVLFDQDYAEKMAGEQDLMPTSITPREDVLKATGQYYIDDRDWTPIHEEYIRPFIEQYDVEYGINLSEVSGETYSWVMLDPEINAWATLVKINRKDPTAPRYLYYRDAENKGYIVPLMPEK